MPRKNDNHTSVTSYISDSEDLGCIRCFTPFSGWATTRSRRCQKIARVIWPPGPDPGDGLHCHQLIEHCYWSWAPTRGNRYGAYCPVGFLLKHASGKATEHCGSAHSTRDTAQRCALCMQSRGSSYQRVYHLFTLSTLFMLSKAFSKKYMDFMNSRNLLSLLAIAVAPVRARVEHESSRGEERKHC
jgi:hypothetical protein